MGADDDLAHSSSPTLSLPAHPAVSQLARLCSKLVCFGSDQSPVSHLLLTWFPLWFNPTSTRMSHTGISDVLGEELMLLHLFEMQECGNSLDIPIHKSWSPPLLFTSPRNPRNLQAAINGTYWTQQQ
uniref:Uncharacterized protein n=1 Tax=Timema monikensis TaxID=170555 RepID=A0A7R9E7F4_9NEOP|nr:unnamed protein product [Timema monikensis]